MIKTIHDGEVVVQIDTLGGQVLSIKKGGLEYLWQRNPRFWNESAPILFPVVGRQKDGIITVAGKQYPMPMHGFLKATELEVISQEENRLVMQSKSNTDTKKMYPWEYVFTVTFTLKEDTLTQNFVIENKDNTLMHFCLGGHPGFNVPLTENEVFSDYQLIFEKKEELWSDGLSADSVILPEEKYFVPAQACRGDRPGDSSGESAAEEKTVLKINEEMFREGNTLIFENLQSRSVELRGPAKKGVRVSFPGFHTLAFWTMGAPDCAPYLCIEPWCGMGMRAGESPELSEKFGVCSIEPGKAFETAFSITLF